MNHEDYKVLAKVRFERAKELVHEAELLIEDNAYKSETLQQIHFAKSFLEKAYTFFENL